MDPRWLFDKVTGIQILFLNNELLLEIKWLQALDCLTKFQKSIQILFSNNDPQWLFNSTGPWLFDKVLEIQIIYSNNELLPEIKQLQALLDCSMKFWKSIQILFLNHELLLRIIPSSIYGTRRITFVSTWSTLGPITLPMCFNMKRSYFQKSIQILFWTSRNPRDQLPSRSCNWLPLRSCNWLPTSSMTRLESSFMG